MPDYKNQHFVPRCVLRPFSLNGEGKAINLYTFGQKRLVRNAPVRNQCARDYIYGADGHIEHGLATIEGAYSRTLARVESRTETLEDLQLLRFFAYLQLRRTEIAILRLKQAEDAFFNEIFGDDAPDGLPIEYFMRASLQLCADSRDKIDDLKVRIVENKTEVEFVTSDDPAIMTNRFAAQKLNEDGFGVISSGLLLVLPLTPKLAALCYDGLVYTAPNLIEGRVVLKDARDVESLNELHYLKAAASIYFSSWESGEYVRDQFEQSRARRIDEWFILKHLVYVGSDKTGDIFREGTLEEAKASRRSIANSSFKYPIPSCWLSELSYRRPPRTYSNGTAIGHVRKREWLQSQR
jgi:hypothetical protein